MNPNYPPIAQRTFRHPGTGELAHLIVRRVAGPGRKLWWAVELSRPDGSSPLAGEMAIVWTKTQDGARQLWAERERALRAAGYMREQAEGHQVD
jgi:hypothetical protein